MIAQLSTNELRSLAEEAPSLSTAEKVEALLSKAYVDLTFDESV
ncbi:hypothetical protein [Candidatus Neptunochlamydia vexilliferae]|nr:hypothetical protein [Candidatus Neptunochlamydia vexilliferae]